MRDLIPLNIPSHSKVESDPMTKINLHMPGLGPIDWGVGSLASVTSIKDTVNNAMDITTA
jgi:hypothetical protein